MNDTAHNYLFNIPTEDKDNYSNSLEYKVYDIEGKYCNTFQFIRSFNLKCTVKNYKNFYYVRPLLKTENIPDRCWESRWEYLDPEDPEEVTEIFELKILVSRQTNLDLGFDYCCECDLILVNGFPFIICRNSKLATYSLSKKWGGISDISNIWNINNVIIKEKVNDSLVKIKIPHIHHAQNNLIRIEIIDKQFLTLN
jgi:hypothetical protein